MDNCDLNLSRVLLLLFYCLEAVYNVPRAPYRRPVRLGRNHKGSLEPEASHNG